MRKLPLDMYDRYPVKNGEYVLVDDADYTSLKDYTWQKRIHNGRTVAVTDIAGQQIGIHYLLKRCSKSQYVTHKDGNGLNNQRSNLGIVDRVSSKYTKYQPKPLTDLSDTKEYEGVKIQNYFGKKRIIASIWDGTKWKFLGEFSTKQEAAEAFQAAKKGIK